VKDNSEQGYEDDVYIMFTLPLTKVDPIQNAVEIDSTIELDTGASLSIISEPVYKSLQSYPPQ